MRSEYNDQPWQSFSQFWLGIVLNHLPIVIFLVISLIGMVAVYWYFSPVNSDDKVITALTGPGLLAAPIFKSVPSQPIVQRLGQSPAPIRIGIISGHAGSDSGAVCDDGLTEAAVNADIARQAASLLQAQGYRAQVLDEFDQRLSSFGGTAVISIHADSCQYYNDLATGFKIAGSSRTDSSTLVDCMQNAYAVATQLPYHANTITVHMTDYHAFRELPQGVPALIIEVGFMRLDRELLTTNSQIPAQGISSGILCYLERL